MISNQGKALLLHLLVLCIVPYYTKKQQLCFCVSNEVLVIDNMHYQEQYLFHEILMFWKSWTGNLCSLEVDWTANLSLLFVLVADTSW